MTNLPKPLSRMYWVACKPFIRPLDTGVYICVALRSLNLTTITPRVAPHNSSNARHHKVIQAPPCHASQEDTQY